MMKSLRLMDDLSTGGALHDKQPVVGAVIEHDHPCRRQVAAHQRRRTAREQHVSRPELTCDHDEVTESEVSPAEVAGNGQVTVDDGVVRGPLIVVVVALEVAVPPVGPRRTGAAVTFWPPVPRIAPDPPAGT
jgi:hypothetical protein